jgi:hypothetical protein
VEPSAPCPNPTVDTSTREAELAAVPKLVLHRAREVGVNLVDMSRAAGRNPAYIHQFIWKGTPRRLDEETRRVIATMLRINEDLLRDPLLRNPSEAAHAKVAASLSKRLEPPTDPRVALFREHESINPALAVHWAPPFQGEGSPASCAVWIDTPHARLRPSDIAYATPDRPSRPGDLVIVLQGEDNRIISIGELCSLTAAEAIVISDTVQKTFNRMTIKLLKIIGITLP